jgi:predicted amidophosphoribosyltransferase
VSRRFLLIDDVTTTGATFRRAAEALLGAGAEAVFCGAVALAPDPRRFS